MIQICQELVRKPSLSGQEYEVATVIKEIMLSKGYGHVVTDSCGNIIGVMDFGGCGKTLLLEAQIDHVGVGDPAEWQTYPYGAFINEGKLYGRGASDQKGAMAAMLCAAADLKRDGHKGLKGRLLVVGTVQQEKFEGFASRYVVDHYHPDLVLIGEASGLSIVRGQRGRAEILVETRGRMAHSANPDFGINAVNQMVKFLALLREKFTPSSHPYLGEGIIVLTGLYSHPPSNTGVLPDKCLATFDRRLLPGETPRSVLGQLRKIARTLSGKDPNFKAKISLSCSEDRCYTGKIMKMEHFVPAWSLPEDHPFIQTALDGLSSMGLDPMVASKAGFGTNGCYYAGVAEIPTLAFGPSREELVHIKDEYIEIEQLISGYLGYYGIARQVLEQQEV